MFFAGRRGEMSRPCVYDEVRGGISFVPVLVEELCGIVIRIKIRSNG